MSQISIKRRVLIALSVMGLCLAALIGVASIHYTNLIEAQGWDVHTYKVLAALHDLDASLNSDRGLEYCATTGSTLFMANTVSDGAYESHYRSLVKLTQDNDAQQQNLAQIDAAWTQWTAQTLVPLKALCSLPAGARRPEKAEIERLGEAGNALRAQLQQRIAVMEQNEEKLLSQRQASLAALQHQTGGVLSILGGVTALLALLTGASLVNAASNQ